MRLKYDFSDNPALATSTDSSVYIIGFDWVPCSYDLL